MATKSAEPGPTPVELLERLDRLARAWRETTGKPLPRFRRGDPEGQLEALELALVDGLRRQATPATAADVVFRAWELVHDRSADDAVRQRVVELRRSLLALRELPHGGTHGSSRDPLSPPPGPYRQRVERMLRAGAGTEQVADEVFGRMEGLTEYERVRLWAWAETLGKGLHRPLGPNDGRDRRSTARSKVHGRPAT